MKIRLIAVVAAGMLLTAGAVLAGESVKITGEIIDTSCYAISGAKGEGHRQCGQGCIKKGSPAGLLETGTDKVYVLVPQKPLTSLPKGPGKGRAERGDHRQGLHNRRQPIPDRRIDQVTSA